MWNTDKRTGKSWAWFCCGIYEVAASDEVGEAGLASPEHAQLLQISEGSPIFIFSRTSYLHSGQAVEYVESFYRADRYKIVHRLKQ